MHVRVLHSGIAFANKHGRVFTCLQFKSFENIVRKGKVSLQAILPFPTMFSIILEKFLSLLLGLKLLSAKSFSLEEPIIFSSTGHRPASLCHGLLSVVRPVVHLAVRACVNFFLKHLFL